MSFPSNFDDGDEYVIAHLSDMHVGEKGFRRGKVQACVREVNELSPNLVVVTGDLTSDGLPEEFRGAKELIDGLEPKTIVIMGNHDSRNVGYNYFEDYFGERMVRYEDDKIFLFAVDSTQPDIDEGHIGREFQGYIHNILSNAPKRKIRAFMLHHHLVPVPNAGRERDILVDAGDVLRMLVEDEAHLVLCGHRHVSWIWEIEGLTIVHAGTVGSRRTRGMISQNYSILRITEDRLSVVLKVIDREEKPMRTFKLCI
jgi:Icc protein